MGFLIFLIIFVPYLIVGFKAAVWNIPRYEAKSDSYLREPKIMFFWMQFFWPIYFLCIGVQFLFGQSYGFVESVISKHSPEAQKRRDQILADNLMRLERKDRRHREIEAFKVDYPKQHDLVIKEFGGIPDYVSVDQFADPKLGAKDVRRIHLNSWDYDD